ncbi:Alpha-catulin [Ooceraea biroi]|uniref:Alpha-catulin n=1 Tax=Ooceraea biroi TaxID=2015173 RepID=A0A026VXH0_OOCBI|nr:Alpha-catulin [Ooceraea biroi]
MLLACLPVPPDSSTHVESAMSLQISTLISHRERPLCSDRSLRAVARVGQAVNLAVERFVTVGETIADDNPEIKQDMYEACKEARLAGEYISDTTLRIKLIIINQLFDK